MSLIEDLSTRSLLGGPMAAVRMPPSWRGFASSKTLHWTPLQPFCGPTRKIYPHRSWWFTE